MCFFFLMVHVQVAQDMIWVWAENGPDAALESALTPAQLLPELDDKEGLASGKVAPANVGSNDLAYGWDTFMVRPYCSTKHCCCCCCCCVVLVVYVCVFLSKAPFAPRGVKIVFLELQCGSVVCVLHHETRRRRVCLIKVNTLSPMRAIDIAWCEHARRCVQPLADGLLRFRFHRLCYRLSSWRR